MREWTIDELKRAKEIVESSSSMKEADKRLRDELGRTYKAFKVKLAKLKKKGISIDDLLEREEKEEEVQYLFGVIDRMKREVDKLRSVSALDRLIADRISDRIESWNRIRPSVPRRSPGRKVRSETAVLVLSDLHIGEVVSRDETRGISEYNFDIFRRRLQLLSDKIFHLLFDCLEGYKFPELRILCLGDVVSGNIIDELVETNDLSIVDQVVDGAYVLAQFLAEQCAVFDRVVFHGIVGNHGRVTKTKRYKRKYCSWDRMVYEMLRIILKNQNIEFHLPKSFFDVVEINGAKFLIAHGDEIRMWMGIPFYNMQKFRMAMLELVKNLPVQTFDYLIIGHFHNCFQMDTPIGEMMVNGSMVGGSEYSIGRLAMTSRPTQLLFGVNKHGMISWRFPVRLDDPYDAPLRYLLPEESSYEGRSVQRVAGPDEQDRREA